MDIQQALSANTDTEDDEDEHNYEVPDLLQRPNCSDVNRTQAFTLQKIKDIVNKAKTVATSVTNLMKKARGQLISNKLNRRGHQAAKDIFACVRERCRNPTAAIYDPD